MAKGAAGSKIDILAQAPPCTTKICIDRTPSVHRRTLGVCLFLQLSDLRFDRFHARFDFFYLTGFVRLRFRCL